MKSELEPLGLIYVFIWAPLLLGLLAHAWTSPTAIAQRARWPLVWLLIGYGAGIAILLSRAIRP